MTKKDILARLQNGETLESIAEDIGNMLNEAEAEYQIEQEELAKEKLAEEAKRADAEALANMINEYCAKHAPEVGKDDDKPPFDADTVIGVFDMMSSFNDSFKSLLDSDFEKKFSIKLPRFFF